MENVLHSLVFLFVCLFVCLFVISRVTPSGENVFVTMSAFMEVGSGKIALFYFLPNDARFFVCLFVFCSVRPHISSL